MRGSARPLTERIADKARSENPPLYLYKFSSRSSILSISSSMSAMRSSLWITSFSMKSRSLVIRPPSSWRNNDVRIPTAAHSTRRMSMAKWIQIGILLIRNFKCLLSWTALANGNMEATKKNEAQEENPICQFLHELITTSVLGSIVIFSVCKCCGQCYSQNLFPHQAQHKGPYSVPIFEPGAVCFASTPCCSPHLLRQACTTARWTPLRAH